MEIMLQHQVIIFQQSQEKQELDKTNKEEQIMKMFFSNLDSVSTMYLKNRELEIMKKRGFNF